MVGRICCNKNDPPWGIIGVPSLQKLGFFLIFFSFHCFNVFAAESIQLEKDHMMLLPGLQSPLLEVSNILPRSTVTSIDFIQVKSQSKDKVYIFLISDRGEAFHFEAAPVPDAIEGETWLLLSFVPDPRLAVKLPDQSRAIPFYYSPERDISPEKEAVSPSLLISELQFVQKGLPLTTREEDSLLVFASPSDSIEIRGTGEIFGPPVSELTSILIPGLEQQIHPVDRLSREFSWKISIDPAPSDREIIFTIPGASLVRHFVIRPLSEARRSWWKTIRQIFIPEEETVKIQRSSSRGKDPLTLTVLSPDLDVEPGLARSWSQIDPLTWRFVLRDGTDAPSLKAQLEGKRKEKKGKEYFLATLDRVEVTGQELRIMTRNPDPLLPQKLSQVNVRPFQVIPRVTTVEAYERLTVYPDHTKEKRHEAYVDLPFVAKLPLYRTTIIEKNTDALKKLIANRTIDLFDEPSPVLWPALSKAGYKILPKLNTEIVVMMTNRGNYFLKEKDLIEAMRKVIQTARILGTSYFQYGRLGTQFAPPGVVGYFPQLTIPELSKDSDIIIEAVKSRLGVDAITLKLHYPAQERSLALVIEEELERAGMTIIPVEIPTKDFLEALLKKLPDLILVPIDYKLGDIAPFLDTFIDSKSAYNGSYSNPEVDQLIEASRKELSQKKRLKLLNAIMQSITLDDPAGIPVLFKRSFVGERR